MENVSHTLAGFALARAAPGKTTPLVTTALVGGANLPDIDLAWSSFRSALVYYHYHRGCTNSIVGFLVLPSLWWLTLLAVDRWLLAARRADRTSPASLLLAAALGIGSHILMDAATPSGVRRFLPGPARGVYGALWVVVDRCLWLILGGTVYLPREGGRRRTLAWIRGACTAAIVVLTAPVVPAACRVAWAAGLVVTIAICHGAARWRWRGRLTASTGVALFVLYAGLCAASRHAALGRIARMATALPGGTSRQVAVLPHPANPLRWEWIIADASSVRHGVVGTLPFFDLPGASRPVLTRNLDAPAVEALMKTCAGNVVSKFFRFPFATVEEGPGGGRDLVVRDARYTRQGRGFAVYSAPLGADGRLVVNRDECP